MLAGAPTYNELKEKKRVLKKTNRLSQPFEDDYIVVQMKGAGSPLLKPSSDPPSEVAKNETVDKFGVASSVDTRRSSSISGQSLFTVEDPSIAGSSEPGSPTALTSSAERLRGTAKAPRINRQLGENIPPPQARRRQSVDFSTRGSNGSSAESVKRTRSLWSSTQKRREVVDEAAGEFQDRYLRNFGTGTMSERQRALNVKRARKMTQLFGQEPPPELIQIHDEREEMTHSRDSRDSTATLSTFLSPTPPLRDRANSTSSTGAVDRNAEDDEEPSTAPFSTATAETSEPTTVVPTPSFQDRRRRAAKLSRFFGVGFQDIGLSPELLTTPSPPASVEVDVKVSGRRFFGVFGDRSKDGDDMQEAIQKLRGLKAG